MNPALRQRKESVAELRQPDRGLQALREYFSLLKTNIDRYEYLKKSGVPDIILYTERGLIDRQLRFLSNVCAEMTK